MVGQLDQTGTGRSRVGVKVEVAGRHGIEDKQENIGRSAEGKGCARSCACLTRSPIQSDAPSIATVAAAAGKVQSDEPAECPMMAFERWNNLRSRAQRDDQQGEPVNLRKCDHQRGQ